MPLDVGRELAFVKTSRPLRYVYLALSKIVRNVNSLATNAGVDTQTLPPPTNIASLSVKSSGTGLVHAVISDPSNVQKNINYFVEYDTNPAFVAPHVEHLGTSREAILRLPGKTDSGSAQSFYLRAYSQYPGSGKPSAPVVFGSGTTPVSVAPGGSDPLTLLPTTGSGTALNSGFEGGSGFGKSLHRSLE
jgi:hypothetical protein